MLPGDFPDLLTSGSGAGSATLVVFTLGGGMRGITWEIGFLWRARKNFFAHVQVTSAIKKNLVKILQISCTSYILN